MSNHLTEQELLDCLKAGWRCRFVPREVSGKREHGVPWDINKKIRDLWLWLIRDDDHPELELPNAVMAAKQSGLVRFKEDHGICDVLLVAPSPPPVRPEVTP